MRSWSAIASATLALLVAVAPARAERGGAELEVLRQLVVDREYALGAKMARSMLRHTPHDQQLAALLVLCSCKIRDTQTAQWSFRRLHSAQQRAAARSACRRAGIQVEADPGRPWRIAAWSTVALSTAALVTAGALGVAVSDSRDDLEGALRDAATNGESWPTSGNACTSAPTSATEVRDLCARGARFATAANVMVGIGIAGVAASAALLYRGYLYQSTAEGTEAMSSARTALRLAPRVDHRQASLSLLLTF